MKLALLLAIPVALFGAVLAVLAWIGSERGMHPRRREADDSLTASGLRVQPVRFASLDGTHLAGWYIAGELPLAAILAHGYGSRREEMLPHAAFLHDAGYSVLLFDFRACGESDGAAVTMGALERQDLLGAARFLRVQPHLATAPFVVLGVSMGAVAAILAAAQSNEFVAVVAESAYKSIESVVSQSFRYFIGLPPFPAAPLTVRLTERRLGFRSRDVCPETAVTRLKAPLLLIHGLDDVLIDPANSRALHGARPDSELWLVEGAAHARAYQRAPEEYRQRVLDFFARALNTTPSAASTRVCRT